MGWEGEVEGEREMMEMVEAGSEERTEARRIIERRKQR